MKIDVQRTVEVSRTPRARQLEGMFDVPPSEKCSLSWSGELPVEDFDWQVGLIVGPSGCGKSTILNDCFGEPKPLNWAGKSVVDDFDASLRMSDIAGVCSAVGFNTIPAWLRPYDVLSNGERFRVDLARRLIESSELITVDEFTSVVDRQVAQIGSHAVQKYARKHGKQFVAASCHYDIVDWLQPDWVFEPATMGFQRRSLQRRPEINAVIGRIPRAAWKLFAPYHYMSANLHRGAKCYGLWANGRLAAFAATLNQPHPMTKNLHRISRVVTLPDWQGLGLAMRLTQTIGAAHKAAGLRLRNYPAHPAFIRSHAKSKDWRMINKPRFGSSSRLSRASTCAIGKAQGVRPCAVFEFCGQSMPRADAERLLRAA